MLPIHCQPRRDSQDAPPADRVAADGRDVEPDVGHWRAVEGPRVELLDVGVKARRDGAHLVLGEPRHVAIRALLITQ